MHAAVCCQIGKSCSLAGLRSLQQKKRSRKRIFPRAEDGTDTKPTSTTELESLSAQGEKTAKKVANTFAPRPSGKVKNPAIKGTLLYDVFGNQAYAGVLLGGLLSFNVLFPSDQPSIAKLMGMWSIWMFTVPSLRARECTATEKDALNVLFLLLPLINITLPFIWKSFPFVFLSDVAAFVAVFYWKGVWTVSKVLLHSANELAVFAIHPHHCALIHRQEKSSSDQNGGFMEGKEILLSLERVMETETMHDGKEPCLSAALSRALCSINSRRKSNLSDGSGTKKGRILIINVSHDVPGQYISFMNSVFAAQHSSVLIDALHLGPEDSSFLQQASHLTGGCYLKAKNEGWILQYLNTYFASAMETRHQLMMENNESVNFAASCFCHEQTIHLGFVCSVCLSVYCKDQDVCLTCGAQFESGT